MCFEQFIEILLLLVAIGTVCVAIWRYYRRPQFIVGVPPSSEEQSRKGIKSQQLGYISIIKGFRHNPQLLATRLNLWVSFKLATSLGDKREFSKNDYRELYDNKLRCREFLVGNNGKASLWIVAENKGTRAARDYLITIRLHETTVHITNVITESLRIDCLYVSNPQLVAANLSPVDRRIVRAYDDYRNSREREGDAVFLIGTLEGGASEIICVEVSIEPVVKRFIVAYELDCSDFWVTKKLLFQGFQVIRSL